MMKNKFVSLFLVVLSLTTTAMPKAPNLSQDIINAAATGNVEQLQKIIAIDKKYTNTRAHHNWTPLHLAAHKDYDEIVEELLGSVDFSKM
ncbi:hypothetical protein IPF37_06645 [bacterium]|nr:MAG: hypothetical protein IPF37_06645 [bacterium]